MADIADLVMQISIKKELINHIAIEVLDTCYHEACNAAAAHPEGSDAQIALADFADKIDKAIAELKHA